MDFAFKPIEIIQAPLPPERVYLDHYGLNEAPFAITPDPEFLYSAQCHQEVLEKIGYAIGSGMGFILLTGEVGTGKTTICRTLLDQLADTAVTAYVINPSISGRELLAGIIEDAGYDPPTCASRKELLDLLHQRVLVLAGSRPFVVIIDDAQTMSPEALEDLRLLSNLETDKRKLVQVVLAGQPELLAMLDDHRLRQLKQRIAVHCHLASLTAQETAAYIDRRLFVAGNKGQVRFSPAAARLVHKRASGIPRLINKVCDCALTAGYVEDAPAIDTDHVRWALAELDGLNGPAQRRRRIRWHSGLSIAMMLAAGILATIFFSLNARTMPTSALTRNASILPIDAAAVASGVNARLTRPPAAPAADQAPQPAAAAPAIAAPAPAETASAPAVQMPYALQLASFRHADNARTSAAAFQRRGIPACWQVVDGGRWYRVFAGEFADRAAAQAYQQAHELESAIVIRAPHTLKVVPDAPGMPVADIQRILSDMGYGAAVPSEAVDGSDIYAGVFPSRGDADIAAVRISASGRLHARAVRR